MIIQKPTNNYILSSKCIFIKKTTNLLFYISSCKLASYAAFHLHFIPAVSRFMVFNNVYRRMICVGKLLIYINTQLVHFITYIIYICCHTICTYKIHIKYIVLHTNNVDRQTHRTSTMFLQFKCIESFR